LYLWSF